MVITAVSEVVSSQQILLIRLINHVTAPDLQQSFLLVFLNSYLSLICEILSMEAEGRDLLHLIGALKYNGRYLCYNLEIQALSISDWLFYYPLRLLISRLITFVRPYQSVSEYDYIAYLTFASVTI